MGRSIAVVIPAYNAEAYVCAALDSVRAQSRAPDRIVVVDDGSSDRTAERVWAWSREHAREVVLLQQPNLGVSAARNAGIRKADCDLVAFLDADDLFLPYHLGILEAALARSPDVVMCFGDGQTFNSHGTVRRSMLAGSRIGMVRYDQQADGLRVMRETAYTSLLRGNYIPSSATLSVKSRLESIGLFDEDFPTVEDRELWLRLSRIGTFAYYPRPLARKRVHANNLQHPRHTPVFQRYQFSVLEKMLRQAADLRLSAAEVRATHEAMADQARNMLDSSSRHGLRAYGRTCHFLLRRGVRAPIINPVHSLRALGLSLLSPMAGH